jgi:hypothetical protein
LSADEMLERLRTTDSNGRLGRTGQIVQKRTRTRTRTHTHTHTHTHTQQSHTHTTTTTTTTMITHMQIILIICLVNIGFFHAMFRTHDSFNLCRSSRVFCMHPDGDNLTRSAPDLS